MDETTQQTPPWSRGHRRRAQHGAAGRQLVQAATFRAHGAARHAGLPRPRTRAPPAVGGGPERRPALARATAAPSPSEPSPCSSPAPDASPGKTASAEPPPRSPPPRAGATGRAGPRRARRGHRLLGCRSAFWVVEPGACAVAARPAAGATRRQRPGHAGGPTRPSPPSPTPARSAPGAIPVAGATVCACRGSCAARRRLVGCWRRRRRQSGPGRPKRRRWLAWRSGARGRPRCRQAAGRSARSGGRPVRRTSATPPRATLVRRPCPASRSTGWSAPLQADPNRSRTGCTATASRATTCRARAAADPRRAGELRLVDAVLRLHDRDSAGVVDSARVAGAGGAARGARRATRRAHRRSIREAQVRHHRQLCRSGAGWASRCWAGQLPRRERGPGREIRRCRSGGRLPAISGCRRTRTGALAATSSRSCSRPPAWTGSNRGCSPLRDVARPCEVDHQRVHVEACIGWRSTAADASTQAAHGSKAVGARVAGPAPRQARGQPAAAPLLAVDAGRGDRPPAPRPRTAARVPRRSSNCTTSPIDLATGLPSAPRRAALAPPRARVADAGRLHRRGSRARSRRRWATGSCSRPAATPPAGRRPAGAARRVNPFPAQFNDDALVDKVDAALAASGWRSNWSQLTETTLREDGVAERTWGSCASAASASLRRLRHRPRLAVDATGCPWTGSRSTVSFVRTVRAAATDIVRSITLIARTSTWR